jgi:hypothetical protein
MKTRILSDVLWSENDRLVIARIFKVWWPLAFSWMLMAVEIPALSAVIARLPNARVNLAAYGGVVYPLALIIEAPIIMLLSASTALCKDWQSFTTVRKYMMWAGAVLTLMHAAIVFTPLYYIVVGKLLQIPVEVVEPARVGLAIMLPWTWAIGYRRFHQGVMIRFGHSEAVGIGTMVRLSTDAIALGLGFVSGILPGIAVAAIAQALGVMSEAIYAGLRVKPILERDLKPVRSTSILTWKAFSLFYGPLVLTSLLNLVWNPIGSAALSRMNAPLSSLAVWPVVTGLVFMLRSPGIAFNEVVIAMLDRSGTVRGLRIFSFLMVFACTAVFLLIAATPLSSWWFQQVSALPEDLTTLALSGLWLGLPLPLFSVMQSWFQGAILHSRNTRAIPESLAVFFVSVTVLLAAGVIWNRVPGYIVAMAAFLAANAAQTAWLGWRSRPAFRFIAREQAGLAN